ncbi:hypothetical protein [Rhabdochlamydiaceae symbiont of Dictyostelium giganteum]|uniref:hypothetical protein n=1 Tax=Rhabdochlamydiaceae symbiont of Dictyostelium giganteum TaxID=3342349 RepID=UPI0038503652
MLKLLSGKGLLSEFSLHDLLICLSHIKKIKIKGEWNLAQVTDKTTKSFIKLGYDITE